MSLSDGVALTDLTLDFEDNTKFFLCLVDEWKEPVELRLRLLNEVMYVSKIHKFQKIDSIISVYWNEISHWCWHNSFRSVLSTQISFAQKTHEKSNGKLSHAQLPRGPASVLTLSYLLRFHHRFGLPAVYNTKCKYNQKEGTGEERQWRYHTLGTSEFHVDKKGKDSKNRGWVFLLPWFFFEIHGSILTAIENLFKPCTKRHTR